MFETSRVALVTAATCVHQPVFATVPLTLKLVTMTSLSAAGSRSHNAAQSSPEAQQFAAESSVCWGD